MISRKTNRANLERRVPFFFRIGLIISICLAIVAFEWKTPCKSILIEDDGLDWVFLDEEEAPVVFKVEEPKELPKPKSLIKRIIPVDHTVVKKIKPEQVKPVNNPDKLMVNIVVPPEKPEVDKFYYVVEVMPSFPGGEKGLLEYLKNNIQYPEKAIKNKIEGIVYVLFKVGKDGEIYDVLAPKRLGGGCEEEAIRVIKNMPKWVPGMQGGVNVNIQYSLPINFVFSK